MKKQKADRPFPTAQCINFLSLVVPPSVLLLEKPYDEETK